MAVERTRDLQEAGQGDLANNDYIIVSRPPTSNTDAAFAAAAPPKRVPINELRAWVQSPSAHSPGTGSITGITTEIAELQFNDRIGVSDRSLGTPTDRWSSIGRLYNLFFPGGVVSALTGATRLSVLPSSGATLTTTLTAVYGWIRSQVLGVAGRTTRKKFLGSSDGNTFGWFDAVTPDDLHDGTLFANYGSIAPPTTGDWRGSFTIVGQASGAPNFANIITPASVVTSVGGDTYTLVFAASLFEADGSNFDPFTDAAMGSVMRLQKWDPLDRTNYISVSNVGTRTFVQTGNVRYAYMTARLRQVGSVGGASATWRVSVVNQTVLNIAISQSQVTGLKAVTDAIKGLGGQADQVWTRGSSAVNAGWKAAHTAIAEATAAWARAGTDSTEANATRMTPRRVWDAIRAAVGGHTNQFFMEFEDADYTGTNARTGGGFWVATTGSGAPAVADRVMNWSQIPNGPGVLLLGHNARSQDDEQSVTLSLPTVFPLHIQSLEGQSALGGWVSFTPDDGTSWATIQSGNKLLNWRRGTFAHTGTLAGDTAFVRMSDQLPNSFLPVLSPNAIVNPPWLKEPTGTRTDNASYINTAANGNPVYGDPLAPLAALESDRYYNRSAVAPGDNLWSIPGGGGRAGYWGIHTNATGVIDDSNVYSNWTAVQAGRRTLWFAKTDAGAPGGVGQMTTSAQVSALTRIRCIHLGTGELSLSNPGAVTSVAGVGGGPGYWRCAFDVTIPVALTGQGVTMVMHSVIPTRRAVAIPYSDLRAIPRADSEPLLVLEVNATSSLRLEFAGAVFVVTGSSAITLSLPNDPTPGTRYTIANTSSATVTLDGNAGDTINGMATVTVAAGASRRLLAISPSAWVLF